jgi:polysaccharide export outer membrane protein
MPCAVLYPPTWFLALTLGIGLPLVPAGAALAQRSTAVQSQYTIRSGDILRITVWGHDDLTREYPVDDDGAVSFPLVGRVRASGLTPHVFAAQLAEALERDYLVNPQVLVSVKEYFFSPAPQPKAGSGG